MEMKCLAGKNNRKMVTRDFYKAGTTVRDFRAKQHQLGIKGNVVACTQTPKEIKLLLKNNKENILAVKKLIFGKVHENDDEVSELQEISRI